MARPLSGSHSSESAVVVAAGAVAVNDGLLALITCTETGSETDGVSTAAMDVMVRWRKLGRVGGQRCDSAAAFLSNMQPSLRSLESTARQALEIIETLQANPFGDK